MGVGRRGFVDIHSSLIKDEKFHTLALGPIGCRTNGP